MSLWVKIKLNDRSFLLYFAAYSNVANYQKTKTVHPNRHTFILYTVAGKNTLLGPRMRIYEWHWSNATDTGRSLDSVNMADFNHTAHIHTVSYYLFIQSCSKSYIFKPNVVPTQSPGELSAFIIHFAHDSVTIIYDFI